MVLQPEHVNVEGYEINMLTQFRGTSLLPVCVYGKNENVLVQYDITGMMSLYQMTSDRDLDGVILRNLFTSIWNCCDEIEEYLLTSDAILLDPKMIYYHPGRSRVLFCYLPGEAADFGQSFMGLIEYCMKCIDHKEEGAVIFLYGLYRQMQNGCVNREEVQAYLNDTAIHSRILSHSVQADAKLEKPEEVPGNYEIDHMKADGSLPVQRKYRRLEYLYYVAGGLSLCPGMIGGIRFFLYDHSERDLRLVIITAVLLTLCLYCVFYNRKRYRETVGDIRQEEKEETKWNHEIVKEISEEAEPIPSAGIELTDTVPFRETSVLIDNSSANIGSSVDCVETGLWILKSMLTDIPDILLHRIPGVFGRQKDCDYILSEPGISRRHAMIFESGKELYVEDLGSTNGTYIDDTRLSPGQPYNLSESAILRMGGNPYRIMKRDPS